jgi:hypothetical protein
MGTYCVGLDMQLSHTAARAFNGSGLTVLGHDRQVARTEVFAVADTDAAKAPDEFDPEKESM